MKNSWNIWTLWCALVALVASQGVAGFTIFDHKSITEDALKGYVYVHTDGTQGYHFTSGVIDGIALANQKTDLDQSAYRHCDDNQVFECRQRISEKQEEIVSFLLMGPPNYEEAQARLGTALHTIQDFYAHSTWVESHHIIAKPSLVGWSLDPSPVCSNGKTILGKPAKFTTGYYLAGNPEAAFLLSYASDGKCLHGQFATDSTIPKDPPPVFYYAGIAKDNAGPYHEKAYIFARAASKVYVDEIRDLLPADKRDTAMCGLMNGGTDSFRNMCPPEVVMSANSTSLRVKEYATLTWESQNADRCVASGGRDGDGWAGEKAATSASVQVTAAEPGTIIYTLSCSNAKGTVDVSAVVSFVGEEPCTSATGAACPTGLTVYALTATLKTPVLVPTTWTRWSSTLGTNTETYEDEYWVSAYLIDDEFFNDDMSTWSCTPQHPCPLYRTTICKLGPPQWAPASQWIPKSMHARAKKGPFQVSPSCDPGWNNDWWELRYDFRLDSLGIVTISETNAYHDDNGCLQHLRYGPFPYDQYNSNVGDWEQSTVVSLSLEYGSGDVSYHESDRHTSEGRSNHPLYGHDDYRGESTEEASGSASWPGNGDAYVPSEPVIQLSEIQTIPYQPGDAIPDYCTAPDALSSSP